MTDQKNEIPTREQIDHRNKWDLRSLFADDQAWEDGLNTFKQDIEKIPDFKGTLGDSPKSLLECLRYFNQLDMLEERLGCYAYLRESEDIGDSKNQDRMARFMNAASRMETLASFFEPEIQSIPDDAMQEFINDPELKEFEIYLEKLLRFKPHVLSEAEERLMALQIEANETANNAYNSLTDADLDFGKIDTPEGEKALSQSTFMSFMLNRDREIREKAYKQYYSHFENHKNTLTSLFAGSVHLDVYFAKARNYPSAREKNLFPDKVPISVYDNLIQTIHDNLPQLYEYYELRKEVLGVENLRHYDVYVPMVKDIDVHHTYEQAVDVVLSALKPLGDEYCSILRDGLLGSWVDRYENKGKRSGAFSAGSYTGQPYIMMNFKEDVLDHVFTLAHEAGHSMHSYYSAKNNPFQHWDYTTLEAEVASNFNEQLLGHYLLQQTADQNMKAYLIGKMMDDIIATVYRQTMFAEFEALTHEMVERGESLTVESTRKAYRSLLEKYFGDRLELEGISDIEFHRIPHFYRAFYMYKYATGLSAAIALAGKVLEGGNKGRDDYIAFLKSGGSRYPLESLKLAGVDMSKKEPIQAAMDKFGNLIREFKELMV